MTVYQTTSLIDENT